MNSEPPVVRRSMQVLNFMGLHMRPLGKFLKAVDLFQSEILVWHQGRCFDGRSILDLMGINACYGSLVEIEAQGEDAEDAVTALADLFAAEFFEDRFGDEMLLESEPGDTGQGRPPEAPGENSQDKPAEKPRLFDLFLDELKKKYPPRPRPASEAPPSEPDP
jgi:phosphocarrier protein